MPVADQAIGIVGQRRQPQDRGAERQRHQPVQAEAAHDPRRRRLRGLARRRARPQEAGQQREGEHEHVGYEPQVMPAEIAGRIGAAEGFGQPVQEGAGELAGEMPLGIDLRRHQHDHAEGQRQQQAAQPVESKGAGRAQPERQHDRTARHQEDQWHAPAIDEAHGLAKPGDVLGAVEMPVPARPGHAGMVEDEQPEGRDPEPVEIGTAIFHGGTSALSSCLPNRQVSDLSANCDDRRGPRDDRRWSRDERWAGFSYGRAPRPRNAGDNAG
jgi:hypothetical protein